MNFDSILNDATLKPWQKTSYFILMVAVVVGGAALVFATSLYLPNVEYLSDAQRSKILETMFEAWGTISGIAVGGNVVARGGVTLLKQWLQGQIVKNAIAPPVPDTVNAAGDVNIGKQSTPAPALAPFSQSSEAQPVSGSFEVPFESLPTFDEIANR